MIRRRLQTVQTNNKSCYVNFILKSASFFSRFFSQFLKNSRSECAQSPPTCIVRTNCVKAKAIMFNGTEDEMVLTLLLPLDNYVPQTFPFLLL